MEKEKKLRLKTPTEEPAQQERQIAGFYVPASMMDQILNYIGQGSWLEVNDFINLIRNTAQPVYPRVEEPQIPVQEASTN